MIESKIRRNVGKRSIDPTEAQIQIAVVQWCEAAHKVKAVHCPNELMRFLSEGQKYHFVKIGVVLGVHDLFLFEPRGKYHGCSIEIKRNKRCKASKEQIDWLHYLEKRGYFVKITYGLDETLETIEGYLNLERT